MVCRDIFRTLPPMGCSVSGVKRGPDLSWLMDRRVIVFGIGCALAGLFDDTGTR